MVIFPTKLTNESLSWSFVFLEFVVYRVVVVDVADVVDVVADVVDIRSVTRHWDNLATRWTGSPWRWKIRHSCAHVL